MRPYNDGDGPARFRAGPSLRYRFYALANWRKTYCKMPPCR